MSVETERGLIKPKKKKGSKLINIEDMMEDQSPNGRNRTGLERRNSGLTSWVRS